MKKIQKERKVYDAVYVSVDGKEFKNEDDCLAWEKSYKGTLAASWKLINKKEVDSERLGLPYSSCDHECYMLIPKDIDEVALINAYINSSTCSDGTTLTSHHIGKVVVLNFGYDHEYCDVYIMEDLIKKITNYAAKYEEELKNPAE